MPSEEEILTSAKIRAKSVHNLLHKEISDYFMEGVNYVLHLKSLQQENQTEEVNNCCVECGGEKKEKHWTGNVFCKNCGTKILDRE